jgi:hypothetical protein
MEKLSFLPKTLLAEIKKKSYIPGYLTMEQIAIACEATVQTIRVMNMAKQLPQPNSFHSKGKPLLWLPSTIAPFIEQYRKGK